MASTSVKVNLDASSFNAEARAMAQSIKTVAKETKATDAALKANGSSVERLENQYKGLQKQLSMQTQLSNKYREAVKLSADEQEKARQKMEAANKAYAEGKNVYSEGSKELNKLEKEANKQVRAYSKITTAHERYKGQLADSTAQENILRASLETTNAELTKQQKYITRVNEEFKNMQSKTSGVREGMTRAGTALTIGLTAPLVAAGAKVVKVSTEFNSALANIGTLSIDNDRLSELKSGIQEIAITVGKGTTDIADGTYQVISAYGDSADTLEMVEINAKAAAAGLATTTDAINLTSAVTKGYGDVSAEATQKASDLAFETVRLGQTTFPELAASMGKVVPSANAMKVSQEELFGVFATLTGVTGNAAEVSTQFGAVLKALMKPSTDIQKALNKMGFESGFAAVEALGLQGTLDGLVKATGGSEEALVNLAGEKEAVTAMLALTGAQADTFRDKLGQLANAAGATDRAFQAQTEGVNAAGFTFQQAMVKMEVAAQKFGDSAAPFIEKGADAISGLADWMNQLSDDDRERLMKIALGLAAIGPAMTALSKGITVANGAAAAIKALGASGASLGTVLAAISSPAGIAVAALAAVGVSAVAIKKGMEAAEDALYNYGDAVEEVVGESISQLNESAELSNMIAEWRKLNQVVQDGTAPAEELAAAKERLKEVESWLNENYGKYMDGDTATTTEAEIGRLEHQNALLRETAILKAQIALSDAKEKREEAGAKIEEVKSKRDSLNEENVALMEQQNILLNHQKAWDDLVNSESYKNASEPERWEMANKAISKLNEDMGQFGKDFSGSGFAGVDSELKDIGDQIEKNDEKLSEYNQDILNYNESVIKEQQAAKELISGMLADMPTDSIESFSSVAAEIAQISKDAQLSAEDVSVFSEKLTEIAHSAGLIPEDVKINVTADGNIETLQMVEDTTNELNGKTVTTSVNADGTQAYAEINGVTYAIASYDAETGEALLTADGQAADMSINLATGKVRQFDREEGEAVLNAIDNASQKARDAAAAINGIKDKTVTITGIFKKVGDFLGFASGTSSSPGGPSIINDEKTRDPRELVVRDGKGYIFEGRNVPIITKPGDQIYTAKQTKQIMRGFGVKHFASGTNNTAFENAKADFTHRKNTSEVSVLEELNWWKEIVATMNLAEEEAKEAEEEIYSLTKKLNEEQQNSYKTRIDNQIEDGERWLKQQIELNYIGYDEQISIMERIDKRHLDTLNEMVANVEMTEEEKAEIWDEYYKAHEDRILEIAELEKKKNKEVADTLMEDSVAWVTDRNYYNDWSDYGDDPLSAWRRVRDRTMEQIAAETDPERIKELQESLKDFGQTMYDQRKEDSERWIETEKYYGNLSVKEEIAAIERRKAYTEQYYANRLIDHKTYIEEMQDLDKEHYDIVKDQLETAVEDYYDAQREQLDARREAIEEEYQLEEMRRKNADRAAELEKLRKQEDIFQNAVTIEGMEKLADIRDQIAEIENEKAEERREQEKEDRLDALDDEEAEIDKREEAALAAVSKHAQEIVGVTGEANAKAASQFNALLAQYTAQQEEIARQGLINIGSVVAEMNALMDQIAIAEHEAQHAAASAEMQARSVRYENNYNLYQTNQNVIRDALEAEIFGSAAARQFMKSGKGR